MRDMHLRATYPKRITTIPNKEHRKHPYLLRGMKIVQPNQLWPTDITYIEMFYNSERVHQALRYRTPNEFESEYFDREMELTSVSR